MNEILTTLYRSVRPAEALKSQDIYESANVLLGEEVEKFAELIIEECANIADKGWADPGHQIKQHFGVSE